MDLTSLWKERANDYWKMATRYLRYIGNSGFLFSVYALFILGTYYYSVLIRALPEHFPAVELITVIIWIFVIRGSIRTFIKAPDSIFLLPTEQRLNTYFQRSILYSFIMQSFVIVLIFSALGPLYFAQISDKLSVYLASLTLVILVKGWNLLSKWEELRLPNSRFKQLSPFVRSTISLFILYTILDQRWLLTSGLIVIICMLYLLVYRKFANEHPLKWMKLIDQESDSLMFFYRIANMFIEVPSVSRKVKERRWAYGAIHFLTGKRKDVHAYMYTRAFVRSNDYFGIYVRLTLIGALLVYFLPEGILMWAFGILFIYMTALQLTTLWPHFDAKVWTDLYPLSKSARFQAFQKLLTRVLVVQTLIYMVASYLNHESFIQSLIVLILGLLVVFIFVKARLPKQLSKRFIF
ncbi:ABC transporter permease [Alkalihalobacillus sp. AL-G]|uniref:ABC transporter permease n=1 Tax=Alkalihalobacillus sp. AL-G TaxID=2926399 RepID=UPI00272CB3B7|nr:ABC transporter permease [Alkalihalobacillus sp. AL-G]WLD94086.1 ABC transporter permease [Alkalihalobacillus sp. AL-G]